MKQQLTGQMDEELSCTARRVETVLKEKFVLASADWQMKLVQKRKAHGGSYVFEASSVAASAKVAVKIYTRRQQLARVEFEAAQAICKLGVAVAPPLLCDVEKGVFVSQWVDGEPLAGAITQGRWEDGLAATGRWLQRLHRFTWRRPGLRRPTALLIKLCDAAAAIPVEMPTDERRVYKQAAAALARQAAVSRLGFDCPVRVHGDFLPPNIILSPQGAVAVDIVGSHIGSRYNDLAQMTAELAVLGEEGPTAGTFDPKLAKAIFLSAYGLTGRSAMAYLTLAEGIELLRRWNGFANPQFRHPAAGRAKGRAIQAILAKSGWAA